MSAELARDGALDIAAGAVAAALGAGASDAEATFIETRRFATEARANTITKLERSTSRVLGVRVFAGNRRATFSTTDFSADGLRTLSSRAVDAARAVGADPFAGLPDPQRPADDDLGLYCEDVAARPDAEKITDVFELERAVRAYDPRIDNSNGSRAGDATASVALVNSRGFSGAYTSSSASRSSSPVARDGEDKRTGGYGSAGRSYASLEALDAVARKAAQRVVGMCGARKPDTMRVPVIFERDVAAGFLGEIFNAVSAANVAVGNSYFADRIGTRVGSPLVTILDDGRLPGGLGSSPFDAEGVPTRTTAVFKAGTLESYLYDSYYARRLGAASTGNAAGGGVGPNNFYLQAGTQSLKELIAGTRRGVLVLETIGFATEYVTGTYSRGASGFYIENGEPMFPIEQFTIAGNVREMLGAIDAVADDLVFDAAVTSPSFRIAEMTVSGN